MSLVFPFFFFSQINYLDLHDRYPLILKGSNGEIDVVSIEDVRKGGYIFFFRLSNYFWSITASSSIVKETFSIDSYLWIKGGKRKERYPRKRRSREREREKRGSRAKSIGNELRATSGAKNRPHSWRVRATSLPSFQRCISFPPSRGRGTSDFSISRYLPGMREWRATVYRDIRVCGYRFTMNDASVDSICTYIHEILIYRGG